MRERLGRVVTFFVLLVALCVVAAMLMSEIRFKNDGQKSVALLSVALGCVVVGYFMAYHPGPVYGWLTGRDESSEDTSR